MVFYAIDLFCGCGGMSLGLERAGFEVLYANDINADALKTYRHNFPKVMAEQGDITKIDPQEIRRKLNGKNIDVIVAGTPCQGFSTSGKRNPNDPRNKLFMQLLKFVKIFRPRIFVMENVSGLLSMEEGNKIQEITKSFRNLGYHVSYKILSAKDYGVPQNRKRVFIVGTSKKIPEESLFPKPKNVDPVTVREALSDLCFLGINEQSEKYETNPKTEYQMLMRSNSQTLHNHKSSNHSIKIQKRFALIPPGKDVSDIIKNRTSKRDLYRLHPNRTARTVTTLPEDFIHYTKNRIPTVREMARLQSFPDDFIFLGPRTTGGKHRKLQCPQYTQVGNAVPPLMSESVFKNFLLVIDKFFND